MKRGKNGAASRCYNKAGQRLGRLLILAYHAYIWDYFLKSKITEVRARTILNSRGDPTVEVDVICGHVRGRASVPSGASTGFSEAVDLRDGDPSLYCGRGVSKAVSHVRGPIRDALLGMDASNQKAVDNIMCELDGTPNKARLGANAILATSLAVAEATAAGHKVSLYDYIDGGRRTMPVPMMNFINGGVHADNLLDIQEFMIVPWGLDSFSEALRAGSEVFTALRKLLQEKGYSCSVGDEGGFAPAIKDPAKVLELMVASVENAGYRAGDDICFAIDVAASEIWTEGEYRFTGLGVTNSPTEWIKALAELVRAYPVMSIEDALCEDDWESWKLLTDEIGNHHQLVGDDLFTTNPKLLKRGIEEGIANAILIKPNQIGTLSETIEVIQQAHANGYATIVSHRSGETEYTGISDLAVALSCGQIKAGAVCRGERTAKYNRLLRIEEKIGSVARYAGKDSFNAHWPRPTAA